LQQKLHKSPDETDCARTSWSLLQMRDSDCTTTLGVISLSALNRDELRVCHSQSCETAVITGSTQHYRWWQPCRRQRLQSSPISIWQDCDVPRSHNTFGDRSFTADCPQVWNNLPSQLRQNISYG